MHIYPQLKHLYHTVLYVYNYLHNVPPCQPVHTDVVSFLAHVSDDIYTRPAQTGTPDNVLAVATPKAI
jgi:hypothetical protein